MIDEFLEVADSLERAALGSLRAPEIYPALPPLRRDHVVLRLLRFEGLGAYTVWVVARSASNCVLRRLIWDRSRTYELGTVEPLMFGSDAEYGVLSLERHLEALQQMVLPPFIPAESIGTDGVNFGVEYGSIWRAARLYWWSEPPQQWRALGAWFDATVEDFDAVLPSHRSR